MVYYFLASRALNAVKDMQSFLKNKLLLAVILFITLLAVLFPLFSQKVTPSLASSLPNLPVRPNNPLQPNLCLRQKDNPCLQGAGPIVNVPRHAPTIQKAINQLANGGTIIVAEGVYKENVVVPKGIKIRIIASGKPHKTIIQAVNSENPVITVSPDASLCLQKVVLLGGSSGVLAGEKVTQAIKVSASEISNSQPHPAANVSIEKVTITKAKNGLLINSRKAFVKDVFSTRNKHWGIVSVSPETKICDSKISSNQIGGILLDAISGLTVPCLTQAGLFLPVSGNVVGNDIVANEGPGIVVCNAEGLEISLNWLSNNTISNILIQDSSDIEVSGNGVWSALTTDSGSWGDGIQVVGGAADLVDNGIWFNSRAGMYFSDSGGSVDSNTSAGNVFACALENGADPLVTTTNEFFGNERDECVVGQGLEPPPPVGSP